MAGLFNKLLIRYFLLLPAFITPFFHSENAYSQQSVITGKVVDKSDSKPVPFANVYFNNSVTGTTTDVSGNFQLKDLSAGAYILIVSCVGYESYRNIIRLGNKDSLMINVSLKPSLEQLSAVEITGKVDVLWRRQLKKFKYNFFGPGISSRSCEILNPGYLDFYEDPETDSFTAESKVPLEIINHRLGYKIYFSLKQFSVIKNKLSIYYGDVRFEELPAKTSGQLANWEVNRYNAYRGSLRHFFRSLMDSTLQNEGFLAYEVQPSISVLNQNNFYYKLGNELKNIDRAKMIQVSGNPNIRYIVSARPVEIIYRGRYSSKSPYSDMPYEVSRINLIKGFLEANTNGFIYDPTSFIVTGNRAGERAADMLPFEYSPPGQNESATSAKLNDMYFNLLDSLSGIVSARGKLWGQEDVIFSTDKPFYLAGDEIWYSAKLIDCFNRRKEEGERILYVDLISPDDSVIIHQTLPAINGSASGYLELPEYLPEGCYLLRGYTDWMRNFSEEGFTGRILQIYSGIRNTGKSNLNSQRGDSITMEFFPEGGNLLNSLESVMAIRAINAAGEGVSINGTLVDDRNNKIEQISTNTRGIGRFNFKPRLGRKYFVRIDGEFQHHYLLPEVKESGYRMSITGKKKETLQLKVEATPDQKDHGAILIVQSGGRVFYHEIFFLEGAEKTLLLSKNQFPEGVLQLNLFNLDGIFSGQRLVYNDYLLERPQISIASFQTAENPTEIAGIKISLETSDNVPVSADLSVSITADDIFDMAARPDPEPGIMLESAFLESIQEPEWYFSDSTQQFREELDNLLLTMTRYRYDWKRISDLEEMPQYEKARMLRISGKATDHNKACAECQINLFPVGNGISFLSATTDGDGEFSTDVPGLFSNATYLTQLVNKRGKVVEGETKLDEDEPYKNGKRIRNCGPQVDDEKIEKYQVRLELLRTEIEEMRTIMLEEIKISGKPAGEPAGLKKLSEVGIYGTADEVIDLDASRNNYISITDAIAKNTSGFLLIPNPSEPGEYKLVLHGPHSFNPGNQDPLFIVDGVELGSEAYDILKTITPPQVEKIEVFKNASASMWGSRGANGVIVIYTRQGDNDLARKRNVINIKGFSPEVPFQPQGNESTGASSSQRTTLFWADNLSPDENGAVVINFKTPLRSPTLTIKVEGITSEGIPFCYVQKNENNFWRPVLR